MNHMAVGAYGEPLPPSLTTARSFLFVPGDRPERFARAAASRADAIILDLEDAVAPAAKYDARRHVADWLGSGHAACVRINGVETDWFEDDLAMTREHAASVMVPKCEQPEDLTRIRRRTARKSELIALVETATGILNLAAVCAVDGVTRVAFGSVDLAAELGVDPDERQALAGARSQLVLASAAYHKAPPIDAVSMDIHNQESLQADCLHATALGFGGKLCIHPNQVDTVNALVTPSADDIAWARDVIAVADGCGATTLDGRMVDRPVTDHAYRVLRRAQSDIPGLG